MHSALHPSDAAPGRVDAAPSGDAPLRLLDVTGFYAETTSGGVKTYLHAKAQRLARHAVSHAVVVPGARDADEPLADSRLHRVRGPALIVSPAYRLLVSARRLRGIIESERPDLIEVGSPFLVPPLVRRALGHRTVPTVGFYHADVVRTFAEPYVPHRIAAPVRVAARTAARRFVHDVYNRFDATVAGSPSVARELRSLGVRRVVHVSLGVDLDRFRPGAGGATPPAELPGVEAGVPVGIYAGRFSTEKRLDVALDGLARIPLSRRPHIVLVGGGPLAESIARRARAEPRLTVVPYVRDRDALAALYAGMDFYLAPGPGETFGLAIGEALASGLPVVTVDRGAGPDRVEGADVSTRYRHGDADDAARALEAMARRVEREGDALRHRAREHAEATLDWDRTVRDLVGLYRELVEARRR